MKKLSQNFDASVTLSKSEASNERITKRDCINDAKEMLKEN